MVHIEERSDVGGTWPGPDAWATGDRQLLCSAYRFAGTALTAPLVP